MKQSKEKIVRDSIVYNRLADLPNQLRNLDNINVIIPGGETLLQLAVTLHKIKAIELLLDCSNLRIETTNKFGDNALHMAAAAGMDDIVTLLSADKKVINSIGQSKFTPLHKAVLADYTSTASLLITLGADVDAITGNNDYVGVRYYAPIHIAASRGNMNMIALLIKSKANVEALTGDGFSAREILEKYYPEKLIIFDNLVKLHQEEVSSIKPQDYTLNDDANASNKNAALEETAHLLKEKVVVEDKPSYSLGYQIIKRKQNSYDVEKALKKGKVIKVDEDEEYLNISDVEDSEPSSSTSSSPDSPPGGGSTNSRTHSAEPANQQPIEINYTSNKEFSANYEQQQVFLQVGNSKDDTATAESLLMALFPWIKDLPQELQQQMLASFIMQRVLEMLEGTTHPDKFITDQLNNQSAEERFATDHTKYYGQGELYQSNAQVDAQVKQDDSFIFQNEGTGTISCDGILIDPLLKHDINFGMPHLFVGLAS